MMQKHCEQWIKHVNTAMCPRMGSFVANWCCRINITWAHYLDHIYKTVEEYQKNITLTYA